VAARGVTVNAVAPGWIDTGSSNDHERAMGRATPARRSGTADEIAAAVAFLAGDGAAYITGQALVIDGGNSIMEERG
jgi:3-oxoacyl-[acyl-carrier protein] reductase